MAELDFEMTLDRMFHEPPAFPDSEAFAKLVELRLDRGWSVRQIGIGVAGLVAGLVGAFQLVNSRVLVDLGGESVRQVALIREGAAGLTRAGEGLSSLPVSGEVMWMAVALGVMAVAFAVTRAVEEFQ
ncbi:hypothetical protein [Caulobacter mirabilis]|nr:hypothetical protein [Caulobacter mirabilis]